MANESKVIGTCAVVVIGVGTANSLGKHKKLPSARFLIGSSMAFLILSALSEGEPEVAKALALAVTTTVVLGQGDGLFSYVNQHGEADTAKPPPVALQGQQPIPTGVGDPAHNIAPTNIYHLPVLTAIPNIGR
jgi:hypothetical protein